MTIGLYVGAGVFWTIAVGLMAAAPAVPNQHYCMGWSLLMTAIASMLTSALLLRCERNRAETIARLAVRAVEEHRGLESI